MVKGIFQSFHQNCTSWGHNDCNSQVTALGSLRSQANNSMSYGRILARAVSNSDSPNYAFNHSAICANSRMVKGTSFMSSAIPVILYSKQSALNNINVVWYVSPNGPGHSWLIHGDVAISEAVVSATCWALIRSSSATTAAVCDTTVLSVSTCSSASAGRLLLLAAGRLAKLAVAVTCL